MKLKIRTISVALSIILSLALVIGCAPGVEVPEKLEPPEVQIDGVFPLQLGTEDVSYEIVFSISNPNPIMVILDSLEWGISTQYTTILKEVETISLGRRLLYDDIYIPANTEVKVTNACAVGMSTLIGEVFMGKGTDNLKYLPEQMQQGIAAGVIPPEQAAGLAQVGAIACMFPLWKLLGADRPPINEAFDTYLEQAVWNPAAEGPPVWTVAGTASFLSDAGPVEVEFERVSG